MSFLQELLADLPEMDIDAIRDLLPSVPGLEDLLPPLPSLPNPGERLPDLPDLGDLLPDLGDLLPDLPWWSEDPEKEAPGTEPSTEVPESEADRTRKELLAGGKKDSLETAEELAETTKVPHTDEYDGTDLTGRKRREALLDGRVGDLDSIKCSEFTIATLDAAGWDLGQRYAHPGTGLPLAYLEPGGHPHFVDLYEVTNAQTEATIAVLDARNGTADTIVAGSEEAEALGVLYEEHEGKDFPTGDFLLTRRTGADLNFVGKEASVDDEFGAGLTAVQLGGIEVELGDRKPGDLQQKLNINKSGAYTGTGHSSQVYSVQGTGVVWLGGAGSPTIEGEVGSPGPAADLEEGWYRIEPGSGLSFVLGPDTAPSRVSSFAVSRVQLIDANIKRGEDATAVGKFEEDPASAITSNGRLPTSPWISWSPDPGVEAIATLSGSETKGKDV